MEASKHREKNQAVMMAFVGEAIWFLFELGFSAIADLVIGLFYPGLGDVRAVREPNLLRSDYGYAPGIVGFTVFLSLLISGLWFSCLRS